MVCGRNVLWPNRSVDETSRKRFKHGDHGDVGMDEKTECRSLSFLVSILRGIIFIVIVVIAHTHIILASRWRFKMHIICFMNN
jgi:hypothetical protein